MPDDQQLPDIKQLARQALFVMAYDLEYRAGLPARYGTVPMRHSILWTMIQNVLGKDEMTALLKEAESELATGQNEPCKTNPQLVEYRELGLGT